MVTEDGGVAIVVDTADQATCATLLAALAQAESELKADASLPAARYHVLGTGGRDPGTVCTVIVLMDFALLGNAHGIDRFDDLLNRYGGQKTALDPDGLPAMIEEIIGQVAGGGMDCESWL